MDQSLDPIRLRDFVGQDKVKQNLLIMIEAAKARGEPLDHILLYGPTGIGKATLGRVIANEMQAAIKMTTPSVFERPGDLSRVLTNFRTCDILFVDEMDRLTTQAEETLRLAIEDRFLDVVIGKGPSARSVRLKLPRFTLIGSTTHFDKVSTLLRERFEEVYRLDLYDQFAMEAIVRRFASVKNTVISDDAVKEIARHAGGMPIVANRLLRRVRDYAQIRADGTINAAFALEALSMLGADELSSDEIDGM